VSEELEERNNTAEGKLYLFGEGMRTLPDTPGVTSDETLSEGSSSPQTPLNAGTHFVQAAMNQRKSNLFFPTLGGSAPELYIFNPIPEDRAT